MQTIAAQAIPNQQLQCQLAGQIVTLTIIQQNFGMFMTVEVGGDTIIAGVICLNLNRIVRDAYLGFLGDFIWYDSQGEDDPIYTGIGTRFQLIYLSQSDLAAVGQTG